MIAYFFRWDAGRISSFASVYSPEVCLPSFGHSPREGPRIFVLPTEFGNVTLKGYHIELVLPGGRTIPCMVFFGVWDSDLQPALVAVVDATERLKNALKDERIHHDTHFSSL